MFFKQIYNFLQETFLCFFFYFFSKKYYQATFEKLFGRYIRFLETFFKFFQKIWSKKFVFSYQFFLQMSHRLKIFLHEIKKCKILEIESV